MSPLCPITGAIFGKEGEHEKCPRCGHCMLCDHHEQSETRHVHYQDYQNKNARVLPTTYHGTVCEVAMCYCVNPDPFQERAGR